MQRVPWAQPYIGEEEVREVTDALRTGWISMGPKVRALEKALCDYVGVRNGIAVASGTAALDVALKAINVRQGDEVIVPCLTYIATANAVRYQHATPVPADIELATLNIDPEDVRRRITRRTKAIVPVDYGGLASDGAALQEMCDDHDLVLLKDGAHSLGGMSDGRSLLTVGRLSTLSLHSAKVMTTIEGGMVFTDDDKLASTIRVLRNQGEDPEKKYFHPLIGHNYRMSDVHAGFGLAQFGRLESFLAKRREIASAYTKAFEGHKSIRLQRVPPGVVHPWFFYPVLIPGRDRVAEKLRERGIETRIGWPYPVHRQPPYKDLNKKPTWPNAEAVARRVLNLPMFYEMTSDQLDYVIASLLELLQQQVKGGIERELSAM